MYNKYRHTATLLIDNTKTLTLRSVKNPDGVDFDFTVTRKRFQPKAEISLTLYNVNDRTLELLSKKSNINKYHNISKVQCDAGYNGQNKLMFLGTVFAVQTAFDSGQKTTNVTVSSFSDQFNSKRFSYSYKQAPRISQVLNDIATKYLPINITKAKLLTADDKRVSQTVFSNGTFSEFITNECTANPNLSVEYYNDTIVISSIGFSQQQGVSRIPIEILSAKTGLIGTPSLTDQNLVKVPSLFNPDYTIGGYLQVDSIKYAQPTVKGEIYKLTHTVSNQSAVSEVEILPDGQAAPFNNLGVAP